MVPQTTGAQIVVIPHTCGEHTAPEALMLPLTVNRFAVSGAHVPKATQPASVILIAA